MFIQHWPKLTLFQPQRLLRPKKKGQQMNHKVPHYPIRGKHPEETEPTKPLTAKWFWHVSIGNWAAQWTTHHASIDDMRWHKNTLLQVLLDNSPIKSGEVSIAMVSSSSFIVHPYSSHLPSMQRQSCHLQPAPGCKLWWPPFTLAPYETWPPSWVDKLGIKQQARRLPAGIFEPRTLWGIPVFMRFVKYFGSHVWTNNIQERIVVQPDISQFYECFSKSIVLQ